MSNNDVVITGMGAITGVGVGVGALKEAAEQGRSGISTITEFDASNLPTQLGAMARAFDPSTVLDAKQVRLAARAVQLAMGAAMEATGSDAEGALGDVSRVGTIVGTSTGGIEVIIEQMEVLANKGPRRVSPFAVPQLMDNAAAAWIALRWGFRGPAYSMSTGCATSMDTLGIAFDMIRTGRLDACLAGGTEGAVVPYMVASFSRANLLSCNNSDPEHAIRPFDRDRDGFVMGEGASLLMLERRDRAEKRGAKIIAKVLGYAATSDAQQDMLNPRPDGRGLATAITQALEQAGVRPSDVGYISSHGQGSRTEDVSEASAIRTVFGDRTDQVPVGAVKSMVGYTLGASGALSVTSAAIAVHDGLLIPNITFRTPDPECHINVINKAVKQDTRVAIANTLGYGGHAACMVLGAP